MNRLVPKKVSERKISLKKILAILCIANYFTAEIFKKKQNFGSIMENKICFKLDFPELYVL